jgi:hypothetical protein
MFNRVKTYIPWEGKLVEVQRVYAEERVKDIEGIKQWLGSDTLLRKDGHFYFCTTIQDAEIISEETVEEIHS